MVNEQADAQREQQADAPAASRDEGQSDREAAPRDEQRSDGQAASQGDGDGKVALDRSDEEQSFVDQDKIDFDPDEGLYSGTAVDGTSEIPGPHLDGDSGELSEEDIKKHAEQEAGDVDPEDTPAAKSPVAKAAEREREREEGGDPEEGGNAEQDGEADQGGKAEQGGEAEQA